MKMSNSTNKRSPRAMPVETILTRYKSKQQLQNVRKPKNIQKLPIKRTTYVRKIRKVKPTKQVPIIVIEDDAEFHPQKLKRHLEYKKVVLKPKPNLKLIGGINSCNKRKLRMPHKEVKRPRYNSTSSSDIVPYSPKPKDESDLSVRDMILLIEEEKGLDDEDLLEILTCPSPVWWEDPLDGYIEDPIFTRSKPAEQKSIRNQLLEEQSKEAERRKQREMDLFLTCKDSGNVDISEIDIHIENRGINFVNKRCKLESLLGNIKKIKQDGIYFFQDKTASTIDNTKCDNYLNKNNNLTTEPKSKGTLKCVEIAKLMDSPNKHNNINTNISDVISFETTNVEPNKDSTDSLKKIEKGNEMEVNFLCYANKKTNDINVISKKSRKKINKDDVMKRKSDVKPDKELNDIDINNISIIESKLKEIEKNEIINIENINERSINNTNIKNISIPRTRKVKLCKDSIFPVKKNEKGIINKTKDSISTSKKKRKYVGGAIIKRDVKPENTLPNHLNINKCLVTVSKPDSNGKSIAVKELNKYSTENNDNLVNNSTNASYNSASQQKKDGARTENNIQTLIKIKKDGLKVIENSCKQIDYNTNICDTPIVDEETYKDFTDSAENIEISVKTEEIEKIEKIHLNYANEINATHEKKGTSITNKKYFKKINITKSNIIKLERDVKLENSYFKDLNIGGSKPESNKKCIEIKKFNKNNIDIWNNNTNNSHNSGSNPKNMKESFEVDELKIVDNCYKQIDDNISINNKDVNELNKNKNLIMESRPKKIEKNELSIVENNGKQINTNIFNTCILVEPHKGSIDSAVNIEKPFETDKYTLSDVNEINTLHKTKDNNNTDKRCRKNINISKGAIIKIKRDGKSNNTFVKDLIIKRFKTENNEKCVKIKELNKNIIENCNKPVDIKTDNSHNSDSKPTKVDECFQFDELKIVENSSKQINNSTNETDTSIPKLKCCEPRLDSLALVTNIEKGNVIEKNIISVANKAKEETDDIIVKNNLKKINISRGDTIKLKRDVITHNIKISINEILAKESKLEHTDNFIKITKSNVVKCNSQVDINTNKNQKLAPILKNNNFCTATKKNLEKAKPEARMTADDMSNSGDDNPKKININDILVKESKLKHTDRFIKITDSNKNQADINTNKSQNLVTKLKNNESHTVPVQNIENANGLEKNILNDDFEVTVINNENNVTNNSMKPFEENALRNKNDISITEIDLTNNEREKKNSESLEEDNILDLEEILSLENIEIPIAPTNTISSVTNEPTQYLHMIDYQPQTAEITSAKVSNTINRVNKLFSYNSDEEQDNEIEKKITDEIKKYTDDRTSKKKQAKKIDSTVNKNSYVRVRKLEILKILNSNNDIILAETMSALDDDTTISETSCNNKKTSNFKSDRRLIQTPKPPNANNIGTVVKSDNSTSHEQCILKSGTSSNKSSCANVSQKAEMEIYDESVKNKTNNLDNNDFNSTFLIESEVFETNQTNNTVITNEHEVNFNNTRRYSTDSATSDKNMSIEYLDMSILDEDEIKNETDNHSHSHNGDNKLYLATSDLNIDKSHNSDTVQYIKDIKDSETLQFSSGINQKEMKGRVANKNDKAKLNSNEEQHDTEFHETTFDEEYLTDYIGDRESAKESNINMNTGKHMEHVIIKHQGKSMRISDVKGVIRKINNDKKIKTKAYQSNELVFLNADSSKINKTDGDLDIIRNGNIIKSKDVKEIDCESCECRNRSILISDDDIVKYCLVCSSIYDTDVCKYCVKMSNCSCNNFKKTKYTCDLCSVTVDCRKSIIDHLNKCQIVR